MNEATYFEILDDVERPRRWFLSDPRSNGSTKSVRGTDLICGKPLGVHGTMSASIKVPGESLDFTFASFGVPVVRRPLAAAIEEVAAGDVQRIPVMISGSFYEFDLLNVVASVQCLNQAKSKITYWPADVDAPELAGTYLSVIDPVVDRSRVGTRAIFRIDEWTPPIIVNRKVAELLSEASGIKLKPIEVAEHE